MIPADWTEHRRDDGERVGWIRPEGDRWVAVDVLGRELGDATDWLEAEAALEARGLAWLAERWWLGPMPVRIAEVSTDRVLVVTDPFGAAATIDAPIERIALPWPAPAALTQRAPSGAGR